MKYYTLVTAFLFLFTLQMKSQCFEIESVLVDACNGSPCPSSAQEGENEMVRFKVGAVALNYSNLSVIWPSTAAGGSQTPWRTIETSTAVTTPIVNALNSSIVSCGYLKQPTGGVLPAGATVLLITSTDICVGGNSFANLSDTMYVIFQKVGNTGGHFSNYATPSAFRTLTMNFSSPASCSDMVSYDVSLLVNQSGGYGGTSAQKDGASVDFTPSGAAYYVNYGCQAPINDFFVNAGADKIVCTGAAQSFTATASSGLVAIQWSTLATGVFAPTNSLITTYTPGVGESGTTKLYCLITKICGTQTITTKDSVNLFIIQQPQPVIVGSTHVLCPGQSTILSYSLSNAANTGTTSVVWLPSNLTTPTISVNTPNTYSINVTNTCGTGMATYSVASSSAAPTLSISSTPTVLCSGQTATLSLSGSTGTYQWNNSSATTAVITVTLPGVYSATITNGCGNAAAFITVNSAPITTVTINPASVLLCGGQTAVLTATSNQSNFVWSTGATTNTISVMTSGVKTVSVSGQCGIVTASVNVVNGSSPTIIISSTSNTLCPNQTATLTASGGLAPYTWSNSSITGSVVTTTGGPVSVSSSNSCGTGTASAVIYNSSVNADVSANPMIGVKPLVVSFTNNSTGAVSYNWTYGNGNTSVAQAGLSQTYTVGGSYNVYLTVSDGACTDMDSLVIVVLDEAPDLVVPNVFTPNGDNANDIFKINALNITEFDAVIYDRWGLQLFSWSDITKGWDGKVAGKLATEGTYFYIINAKDTSGKELKKQGSFLLIK